MSPTNLINTASIAARALMCTVMLAQSILADDWTYGRATWYDDNQQGSCHYYKDIPEWYAAWPDTQIGFSTSCGTCWEVACMDTDFRDGYGEWLHRSNACKDTGLSVKIKIVDSCPCIHQNFYSNQRWCCGDMPHIDLGRRAFEQLADLNIGVIGLKWRQVSCDYLGVARTDGKDPTSQPADSGATSGDGTPVTRTQHTFGDIFAAGWMGQTLNGQSGQQSDSSSKQSQNDGNQDSRQSQPNDQPHQQDSINSAYNNGNGGSSQSSKPISDSWQPSWTTWTTSLGQWKPW